MLNAVQKRMIHGRIAELKDVQLDLTIRSDKLKPLIDNVAGIGLDKLAKELSTSYYGMRNAIRELNVIETRLEEFLTGGFTTSPE